jgi:hypothetical protein
MTANIFRRLLALVRPPADPWTRTSHHVPARSFGSGSVHEFPWYFEGESTVAIGSVEELCAWLARCEYASDPELFRERDFWQHPLTFEQLRRGDCEDHALWAWRKLCELGIDAELVVGHRRDGAGGDCCHAWVVFEQHGERMLLETVARTPETMVQPLSAVRDAYLPEASVDGRFARWTYAGRRTRKQTSSPGYDAA